MFRGCNALQYITSYNRDKHTTNATDECFSAVVEKLQKENQLVKEDIQQYDLGCDLFTMNHDGYYLESRVQYIVDWDPMILSLPCTPENGDWLPIRWSTNSNKDSKAINFVLKKGINYFPEKFGFVFCEGTHQQNAKVHRGKTFQRACKKYWREEVINEVITCIKEYCSASTSAGTTTTTNKLETSFLVSAITDEAIQIDCLYILFRDDPHAALLMLQQKFVHVLSAATEFDIPAAAVATVNGPVEQVTAVAASIVPVATAVAVTKVPLGATIAVAAFAMAAVPEPAVAVINSNNEKLNSSSSNASSNNNNNTDTSFSISRMDTRAATTTATATATAIVVDSITTINHNNNNNNDDNNHHHRNVTHYQPTPSSPSSSVNGKKRKQHEM